MMKSSVSGKNISLTSYDDIFSTEESRSYSNQERIVDIPLNQLFPFRNHPFRVVDDEQMEKTAESIKEYGVLMPGIARPRPGGGYEIISGHRRKRASEIAGKATMPVIIRDMDDDSAIIYMVDSNLQRENILPSERAAAYKMKKEAVQRKAGRPSKENSSQVGTNFRADQAIAEEVGSSRNQVQRFLRLNNLVQPILDMVDKQDIAFTPAVELSYLKPEEQSMLLEAMASEQATPSLSQAQRLKKMSQEGSLSKENMTEILSEVKKPPRKALASPTEQSAQPAAIITNHSGPQDGFIMLPIEPFLKFLPKSLFQNPTPESQEKMTKLFLRMAELYKKYITRKKEQQR